MLLSNRNKSTNLLYTQINWILSTGNNGLNKVNEIDLVIFTNMRSTFHPPGT